MLNEKDEFNMLFFFHERNVNIRLIYKTSLGTFIVK